MEANPGACVNKSMGSKDSAYVVSVQVRKPGGRYRTVFSGSIWEAAMVFQQKCPSGCDDDVRAVDSHGKTLTEVLALRKVRALSGPDEGPIETVDLTRLPFAAVLQLASGEPSEEN